MDPFPILREGKKGNGLPETAVPFLILFLMCILLQDPALHGQGYRPGKMFLEAGTGANFPFFDVGATEPGISTQVRTLIQIRPSWRAGANVGFHHTRGTDMGTKYNGRGYLFTSNLNEVSLRGYYVVTFRRYPPRKYKTRLEPKAYAGIGVVQIQPVHNQQLNVNENAGRFNVAPLCSAGLACSYRILNQLSGGVETGGYISTSDFLEGYSDQPQSHTPDFYFSLMVTLMYHVSNEGF